MATTLIIEALGGIDFAVQWREMVAIRAPPAAAR